MSEIGKMKTEIIDLSLSSDDEVCIGDATTVKYDTAGFDFEAEEGLAFDAGEFKDMDIEYVRVVETQSDGLEKNTYGARNAPWLRDLQHTRRSRLIALDSELKPKVSVKRKEIKEESEVSEVSDNEVVVKKAKNGQGPKVMRWCVTWNNPSIDGDELSEKLKENDKIKGFAFQKEVGKNGTQHFQMYLEFKSAIVMTGVKKVIGDNTIHCESTKMSKETNIKYCTKEEGRMDGPWIFGTCFDNKGQGKRTDLDDFAKAVIAKGGIDDEIESANPGMVMKYSVHAKRMIADSDRRKAEAEELKYWAEQYERQQAGLPIEGQKPRDLVLLFGPTAVGKTTQAMLKSYELYRSLPFNKDGSSIWWDGYDNNKHKSVLIDEWRIGFGTIEQFNQITNKGSTSIQFKGSTGILDAETMFFTTNHHPSGIYKMTWKDARFRALARRFKEVHWWNDKKELTVLKNPDSTMGDDETSVEEWENFWKNSPEQRPVAEGDSAVPGESTYFTW